MDPKISYLFIFGIITIITGKPASYNAEDSNYVRNEYDIESLLQSLADQGKFKVVSNYRQEAPKRYHENKAGSSRYDLKSNELYYKADSPQYYESNENANEEPSISDLQMINEFLKRNDAKLGSNNAQNLLEDLLSLDRNNKFHLLRPSEETDNINEVVALLHDLQRVSDSENGNYRYDNIHSKERGDNVRANFFYEDNYKPKRTKQLNSAKAKNSVMKLVENIVGNRPQYRDAEYLNLDDNESSINDRDVDSYNDRDGLRCSGKSCARTKSDNGDKTRLRCRGRYCTRSNDNDRKLNYDSSLSTQKIKINDQLDAVVLGVSDVKNLMTKIAVPKLQRANKLRGSKINDVNFENPLNNNIDKKDSVEAIVFDLTKVKNGDAVARQIKQLLTQNNAEAYNEYEDYGNLVEDSLKKGSFNLQNQRNKSRVNSKILPRKEDNNNLYLPERLLDEVLTRSYRKDPAEVHISRSLFPLTRQQKERMSRNRKNQKVSRVYRRNLDQDVGVPFHMEIQGLGQVNP